MRLAERQSPVTGPFRGAGRPDSPPGGARPPPGLAPCHSVPSSG